MSLILRRFARPQCLAATHLSSPEVGNGLSGPKPQCTCNAMVTSQTQHCTNEGVLRSNSACSMLMSDDLRLPRRGIEPRPFGFRDIDSTSRPSPLPLGGLITDTKLFKKKLKTYLFNLAYPGLSNDPDKLCLNMDLNYVKFGHWSLL